MFVCWLCRKKSFSRGKNPKYCSKRCWASATARKSWASEDFRKKHRLIMQKVYSSPIVKEKLRNAILNQYAEGLRSRFITRKANAVFRRLCKNGDFMRKKSFAVAKGKQERRRTKPDSASKYEKIMRAHLVAHRRDFVEEFAKDVFNIDFALVDEKIAVEVDGGCWHHYYTKKPFDIRKEKLLKKEGWSIYRNVCPFCGWVLKTRK